jgi:putative tricarboxylic transport membrane protein
MPFITGALLGLFGLILMASSIVKSLRVEGELDDKEIWVKGNWIKVLFTLIALFGYGFLLELLGFLVTTCIFLFFLFKLNEPKRWAMPLVISGITVILSYLFFAIWLKSPFPKGILGF